MNLNIIADDLKKEAKIQKFRLITRSDMDGLVCAVLLKNIDLIEDILFVHPKDMQDGKIDVLDSDITANLPYHPNARIVFDHHESELTRIHDHKQTKNYIINADAPSAARVIYDFFGAESGFENISAEMMDAVDKADSANFTRSDILNPQGWVLLSFLMDARTGLGRFRDFTISNYQLMMDLIDHCGKHQDIEEIFNLPDVKQRVDLYYQHQIKFREQIERCTTVHGNLALLDLRTEETIWAGNRFVVYALFPQCNISCHVIWGRERQNTVLAVGKSILDRSSTVNVGEIMLEFGGGGHNAAGTCQVNNLQSEEYIQEIIRRVN